MGLNFNLTERSNWIKRFKNGWSVDYNVLQSKAAVAREVNQKVLKKRDLFVQTILILILEKKLFLELLHSFVSCELLTLTRKSIIAYAAVNLC